MFDSVNDFMLQCKHFQENIFMSSELHTVYTDKQQAVRLGLKRYVRDTACPKDGTYLRYTCDTQCVECCRLKLLNRYVNNPQKENDRSKAYRLKNADEVRERITPGAGVRKHLNSLAPLSITLMNPCGSWLACDSGSESHIVIAGKPAPTLVLQ